MRAVVVSGIAWTTTSKYDAHHFVGEAQARRLLPRSSMLPIAADYWERGDGKLLEHVAGLTNMTSAAVERLQTGADSGGGVTQVWGTAGANVPCRVDPLGGLGGVILAGRIDERSTHLVTVPPGSTISSNDRFAIQGRGTFEVTATREQTAEMSMEFEVIQVS